MLVRRFITDKGADCDECMNNRDLDVYSYCASLYINDTSYIIGIVTCDYINDNIEFYNEDACNQILETDYPCQTCVCDGLCYTIVKLKPGEKHQPKISCHGNFSVCD